MIYQNNGSQMKKFFDKISKFLDKIDDAVLDSLLSSPLGKVQDSDFIKDVIKQLGINIKD